MNPMFSQYCVVRGRGIKNNKIYEYNGTFHENLKSYCAHIHSNTTIEPYQWYLLLRDLVAAYPHVKKF